MLDYSSVANDKHMCFIVQNLCHPGRTVKHQDPVQDGPALDLRTGQNNQLNTLNSQIVIVWHRRGTDDRASPQL